MLHIPFDDLSIDHIRAYLNAQGNRETVNLEFKEQLNFGVSTNKDEEKYKFIDAIASFANTEGGHLIYGINDSGSIVGQMFTNLDTLILTLHSVVRELIEPRVRININSREVGDGRSILIVRIYKSYVGPHSVRKNILRAYLGRSDKGKFHMDHTQIHQKFINLIESKAQVLGFIDKRRKESKPKRSTHASPISRDPYALFHLFANENTGYLLPQLTPKQLYPYHGPSWDTSQFNFDGIIVKASSRDYMQVFNTPTCIEIKICYGFADPPNHIVYAREMGSILIDCIGHSRHLAQDFEWIPPYAFFLSMHNFHDIWLDTKNPRDKSRRLSQEQLVFGSFVDIEGSESAIGPMAKPWLDQLWRAFGYEKCGYYREDGTYDHQSGTHPV